MNTVASMRSRAISDVAERQMRAWSLQLNSQQQLAKERAATPLPKLVYPYLVVSREAGVDARDLAGAVAAKCGWKLLDRELLDYIAEHDHLSRLALDFVDERAASWFHELFGKWLEQHLVSQAEYVSRLGKVVLLAAQHESTVFVGRGIQFFLPRQVGLSIRVVAPRKLRIEWLLRKHGCSAAEAEKMMDDIDGGRAQFVRRYFHRDVADPLNFDMVLNLAHLDRDEVVNLMVRECERLVERRREFR